MVDKIEYYNPEDPPVDQPATATPAVTAAARKDPVNAGATDAEIAAGKQPAQIEYYNPEDMPVDYQPPPPPPPPESLWKKTLAVGYGAAQGLGGSFHEGFKELGLAAGTVIGLVDTALKYSGYDTSKMADPPPSLQDQWFKNFVAPNDAAASDFAVDESAPFGVKAAHALGGLAGFMAQMILGGKDVPAVEAGAGFVARGIHSMGTAMTPAMSSAIDIGQQAYEQTGDPVQAIKAGVTNLITTSAAAFAPGGMTGNVLKRAAVGAATMPVVGEAQRIAGNLTAPESMHQEFSGENVEINALTGMVMSTFLGSKGGEPRTVQESPMSEYERTQAEAAQAAADAGGDALTQVTAAAVANAHATAHGDAVEIADHKADAALTALAQHVHDQALRENGVPEEEIQKPYVAPTQDSVIAENKAAERGTGFAQAEADQATQRQQEENKAYAQKSGQPALEAAQVEQAQPAGATLADIMPQEVKNLAQRRTASQPAQEPAPKVEAPEPDTMEARRAEFAAKRRAQLAPIVQGLRTARAMAATTPESRPLLEAPKPVIAVNKEGVAEVKTEATTQPQPTGGLAVRRAAVAEERPRVPPRDVTPIPEEASPLREARMPTEEPVASGLQAKAPEAPIEPAKEPAVAPGLQAKAPEAQIEPAKEPAVAPGLQGEPDKAEEPAPEPKTLTVRRQRVSPKLKALADKEMAYQATQRELETKAAEAVPQPTREESAPKQGALVKRRAQISAGVGPKAPKDMTPAEINKELERLDKQQSKHTDAMIAAGRGRETPTETRGKTDELATAINERDDRAAALRQEIRNREGPSARGTATLKTRRTLSAKPRPVRGADEAPARATPEGQAEHHAAVVEALAPLVKRLGKGVVSVHEHETSDTVPGSMKTAIRLGRETGRLIGGLRGIYDIHGKQVHIFSSTHDTPEDAALTGLHEGVGHLGVRVVLGDRHGEVMDDIYKNASDKSWMRNYAEQHSIDRSTEDGRRLTADEYVAHIAEEPTADPTMWRKIMDNVRRGLRALHLGVKEWNENDIRALLRRAASALDKPLPPGDPGVRFAQDGPTEEEKAWDPEHPLALAIKVGATQEAQADYNPGFARRRYDDLNDLGHDKIQTLLGAISRRNIPDFIAKEKMPAAHDIIPIFDRMDGRRNELMTGPDARAEGWRKYTSRNNKESAILSELMHAARLSGTSPADAYEAPKTSPKTPEGIAAESLRRTQWRALKKFYDALSPAAKAIYKNVRDDYKELRRKVEQGMEDRINRSIADGQSKRAVLDILRKKLEAGRGPGDYFPLARFGKYWASARDSAGNIMSFTRSEKPSELRAWRAAMEEKGFTTDGGEQATNEEVMRQVDPGFVKDIVEKLEGDPELQDEIWQHYLRTLPEMSMRKHFMHAQGRLGFTADALRAYADYMFHGAHQLARLEYMPQIDNKLTEMFGQARATEKAGGPDAKWAMPLYKEFVQRHEWAKNPTNAPWAQKATAFGFAWQLGMTPAAALVNMSQTPMMALPILAGHHGFFRSGAELAKAGAQWWGGRGDIGDGLRGDERRAYDEAKRVGLFSQTNVQSLAGLAAGEHDYSSRTQVLKVAGWMFQKVEEANRQVTFLAAYRLARAKGIDHDTAITHGEKLTWDAHLDYSNANRPRYMQGDVMKAAFLFRQYNLGMTYRLARDAKEGIFKFSKNTTPEARKQALMRLGGILGMTMIHAGVSGLPLYWAYKVIAGAIMGDKDKPFDADAALRKHLSDRYGEFAADAIMKGPVDATTGATLSNRVSLNNMWIQDPPEQLEGAALATNLFAQVAGGPLLGIVSGAFQAEKVLKTGQIERGLEYMMPKAVKDLAKALRYMQEGVTDLHHNTIVDKKNLTNKDLFVQAMGFAPLTVQRQQEQNSAIKDIATSLQATKADILNRFALGVQMQDSQMRSEALADARDFDKANPGIAIGPGLFSSMRNRMMYSAESVNGVRVAPGLGYLYNQYGFAHDPTNVPTTAQEVPGQ